MSDTPQADVPALITVDKLFAPPERMSATISPDGRRIAYLAPWKGRLNVWVRDLDASDDAARCVTADDTRTIYRYTWTGDSRYLVYAQDCGGDENWHLFRIDLDDANAVAVDLTPYDGARVWAFEAMPGWPGKLSLQLNARRIDEIDLYVLDVATGELTLVAQKPEEDGTFIHTATGQAWFLRVLCDGNFELCRFDAAILHPVRRFDGRDHPLGLMPLQPTPDGAGAWIGSHCGTDRLRLVRLNLATGEETRVEGDPNLDLNTNRLHTGSSPIILHPRTGELLGARYHGEREVIYAVDPDFAEVLPALRALGDGVLATLSCDHDARRWVVELLGDRDPGTTWLHDRDTGENRLLFRAQPALDSVQLASTSPIALPARDGLDLHGYLTLPIGVEPRALPTVVLVHGGPWAYDEWTYDPEVQFLTNRGYAVLQVNFRGSMGYGIAHTNAAVGEFAAAMHTDLLDAVDWAVAQGYTDPARVGIMGGSYGGYAALVGAAFTPTVFAAAVDLCGIADLVSFTGSLPPAVRPLVGANWGRYVGDPDDPAQAADMHARSPITRADDIITPLLVAQGANDVRVLQSESDRIVNSLRARGVDVEYVLKQDEGHGFVNSENQKDYYRAVERFLARHLGGRADTTAS